MSGKNLQLERIRAGIKQWEMVEALKIEQSLLSKIENDRVNVSESMEQLYLNKLRELKKQKYGN